MAEIGLSDFYYAECTSDTKEELIYKEPKPIAGIITLNINPNTVEWTSDPYEWIGSICVDFKLDILTAEEAEENIRKAGGVMVFDYDDHGHQI